MKDRRRLEHKIARSGTPDGPIGVDGRELVAADRGSRLRAVLQEIDEVILPSTLTFRNDAGHTLALEVANRRVLRIENIPVPRTDEDGEFPTARLVEAIEGFVAGEGVLKVRSAKLGRQISPDEIGCSSETLAKELAIDLYGGASEDLIDRFGTFVDSCAGFSTASFRLDASGIVQKSGPEEDTRRLAALAESDLLAMDRQFDRCSRGVAPARCAIVGSGDDGARSIAYVKADTSLALILVASEHVPEVNALWHRIHR